MQTGRKRIIMPCSQHKYSGSYREVNNFKMNWRYHPTTPWWHCSVAPSKLHPYGSKKHHAAFFLMYSSFTLFYKHIPAALFTAWDDFEPLSPLISLWSCLIICREQWDYSKRQEMTGRKGNFLSDSTAVFCYHLRSSISIIFPFHPISIYTGPTLP